MPFESANYHLKRAIGPNTSSRKATMLAVRRHQRRFFNNIPWEPVASVSIGGLTLKNEKEIAVKKGESFDVLLTAQSFTWNSNNFYCHNDRCNWLTTGSCVHVLLYKDDGVDTLGQLDAIHVDVPQRSASVQIKRLKIASTLKDKMLELLDGKEPQSDEEAGVYINLEDSLELVGYATAKHFLVEEITDDLIVVDVKNISASCILHKVGNRFFVSVVCSSFERD